MSSKPLPQGSLVLLWAGEDPALHAALMEKLESAAIPFVDESLGEDEVAVHVRVEEDRFGAQREAQETAGQVPTSGP